MTKPVSFRLEESVIQTIKDGATAAGVSQADFLTSAVANVGTPTATVEPPESERIATLLSQAVAAQGMEAELRSEIRELKRQLRATREPDGAPKPKSGRAALGYEPNPEPIGTHCPHNKVWRLCKWVACQDADPRARDQRERSDLPLRALEHLRRDRVQPIPKPGKVMDPAKQKS